MKKFIYYILTLFFLQATITACTDTEIYESPQSGNGNNLKIILNVPVDNGRTRGLVHGPDEDPTSGESTITDIYALAFKKATGKYLGKFQSNLSSNNTLLANINIDEIGLDELTVVVLANLSSLENGSALVSSVNGLSTNQTKEQVLKSLQYGFNAAWTSLAERPLPMWGETDITPVEGSTASGTVNLYRAVSKINVTFNEGKKMLANDQTTEVFKLKSVRVYYARTSGLAGSLHAPVTNQEDGTDLIDTPSIPDGVEYFPRYKEDGTTPNNLLFETTEAAGGYAIENQIYVPESDQHADEPMCLVIGGYYMGSDKETFYRVDFKQGNQGNVYYDAIRNHIYNFNINTVTRPGTDEPDPALDHVVVGMDVKITDWSPEYMQGIGGQYTLEVETGALFIESTTGAREIGVKTTNNEGWTINSQSGSWFTAEKSGDASKIIITPKYDNKGGQRYGELIVKSGNLYKTILIRQKGKGTANCYVVSSPKDASGKYSKSNHELIVTVKGNGEEGLIADGYRFQDPVAQSAYISPTRVKIIWQTAEGLITLPNALKDENGKDYLPVDESGIITYQLDLSKQNENIKNSNYPDMLGGNALIGGFNDQGELLWSWHIWACPDFDPKGKGEITTEVLEDHSQVWVTGRESEGYNFLDRNLGALSCKPGLSSLGLLYQWGRKDPFIGVASISEAQRGNRMKTENLTGYEWKSSASDMNIDQAVKSPTTLINGTITGVDYSYLWGTNKGFSDVQDAGNKTIYDPCPEGYRVPPVSAVVFQTSSSNTSKTKNYTNNNRYWPRKDKYIKPDKTDSYGFWLNYSSAGTRPTVPDYDEDKNRNNSVSIAGAAWLPISGVYDGNIDVLTTIDGGYSTTHNSIIWTNSSIEANKEVRPGALFLHGYQNSNSGGHLHKLIENDNSLYAKKTHAGSVRCIRDSKSSIHNAIQVPEEIVLDYNEGSTVSGYLTSISESWEVTDPGAKWVVMTPDQGTSGSQQVIKFTATLENTSYSARQAEIKIKFSDNTERSIKVTQKGKPQPTVTSLINLAYSVGATANGYITAGESWQISDWGGAQDWLEITPNSGSASATLTFKAKTANPSYTAKRTATIKVTFGGNIEKQITVTQAAKPQPTVTSSITLTYNADASKTGNISNCVDSWEVTNWDGAQDWLEIDPSFGTGNKTLTFKAKTTNPSYTAKRTATIKVTFGGSIEKQITVTQSVKPQPTVPSPISLAYNANASRTGNISNCVDNWEVTDWDGAQDWLEIDPSSGTGNKTLTFRAKTANPDTSARTARVTIRFGGNLEKQITVTQAKKPTPISVSGSKSLTFAGYTERFWNTYDPSSQSVAISGDEKWTAMSDSDWLQISASDGWGSKYSTTINNPSSGELYIKPQKNTDKNAKTRTGEITLTGQETGTKITITVTQGIKKE